ncbi:MAG: hypothetical protein WCK13_12305 [Ignavibacteriota bacterium]
MQNVSGAVLQESAGPLPKNRKQKKSPDRFWRNNHNEEPLSE